MSDAPTNDKQDALYITWGLMADEDCLTDLKDLLDRCQNPEGRDGSINEHEWQALRDAYQHFVKANIYLDRFLAMAKRSGP